MSDQHTALIKTPRQLITVVVLAFVVPVIVIILLAVFVTGSKSGGAGSDAMTPEAVAERLRPVGTVALQQAVGARALQGGEAVYKAACAVCHTAGVAGAPKTGDAGVWGARLKQGFDTLVKHAVEGFKTMPAKGGNPDLDPIEVARAVAFMGNQSGGKFTEPAAPAAAKVAAAGSAGLSGEQVVKQVCSGCHESGKGGAPRIGDRAAWANRVSRGVNAVTDSAIHGHAGMPARGGMASITDPEMRAAVLYMFNAGGGAAGAASAPATATDRDRHFDATGRCGSRGGQARWREGVRGRLQRLPRGWRGRRAEVRRQGRVGRACPAGDRRVDGRRGQGQGRDAADGRTDECERGRPARRRRTHARHRQVGAAVQRKGRAPRRPFPFAPVVTG
jgi:cytochrome c5